jgi:hypothetical protein
VFLHHDYSEEGGARPSQLSNFLLTTLVLYCSSEQIERAILSFLSQKAVKRRRGRDGPLSGERGTKYYLFLLSSRARKELRGAKTLM